MARATDSGEFTAEQAQRILAAARRLVAERGVHRSHVLDIAREAGFSRGVVTYYFGTKNALLGEVIDADATARLERLREVVGAAGSLDELVDALASTLGDVTAAGESGALASLEFAVLASRDEDLGRRHATARRSYRDALAEILLEKERAGLIVLRHEASHVAAVLVALGQGLVGEALADPSWDHRGAAACAAAVIRDVLA